MQELEPLADVLLAEGKADEVYERALAGRGERCILFEPAARAEGEDASIVRGACARYEHRPLVCRMFGFAGVRRADGRATLAACRVHKAVQPDVVERAHQAIGCGAVPVPVMADYALELGAAGGSAAELLPLNEALARAIEKRGAAAAYAAAAWGNEWMPRQQEGTIGRGESLED